MRGFSYNGELYPFDIYDVQQAERFEAAVTSVSKEAGNVPLDGRISERMRWLLQVYRKFVDDVFGAGTADKMLGDCTNVKTVEDVCYAIINMANEQRQEYEAETRARRLKSSKRPK